MVLDWQGAGLLKPSVVKPVITTIERGLVLNKLGQLMQDDRALLKQIIPAILG